MTVTENEFKCEVKALAREIGVSAREIHIRKMKRKWASCSNKGRLTFSTELYISRMIFGVRPSYTSFYT